MKLSGLQYLFLFLVTWFVTAQQPVSIHLTEKDGLPDIEFYDILEDQEGFIWLAADKGLYRYDGKHYKLFTNPVKRGRSLFGLTLDAKGRLWCNNLSGQFFYVEDDELKLFKDFKDINTLVDFYIYNNHLLISANNNLVSVNLDTKTVINTINELYEDHFNHLNALKEGFYFNKNNLIYFTEDTALKNVQPIHKYPFETAQQSGSKKFFEYNNHVFFFNELISSKRNTLFYITNNKDLQEVQLPEILSSLIVVNAYQVKDKLWVLTNRGIFITEIKNNNLIISERYFKNSYTTDLIIDSNTNFWVTTLKDGVFVMPNLALKKIVLPNNVGVTAIEKTDHEDLYLATLDFNIFNYSKTDNGIKQLDVSFRNNIYGICYNSLSNDLLMVATTESVFHNSKEELTKKSKLIVTKSISVYDEDQYLVSLPHALSMYSKKGDSLSLLRLVRSYGSVLNTNKTKAYCNFIDGFGVVDLKTKAYKKITYNDSTVYGAKIAITKDDIVWVATYNKGLFGFVNDTLKYQLDANNGLASNVINVITPDEKSIWIATDKGLQNYNYDNQKVITVNKEDGIDSYNINSIVVQDDDIFFGSNMGLYKFNSKSINKTRKTLQPYFTSVSILEKDTIIKTNYELEQTESEIRFGFNVNGFQSNEFVNYEYKLEGYSDNWIAVEEGLDFVKFNTLPAGKFTFHLRAKNTFQKEYTQPISVVLKVRLPFYKTWWFYTSLLIISITVVWWYFSRKTARLNAAQQQALEKAKINQQLVFSQLENLRSQMNPHFIFNALNSIQDYIILNEKKLAREYLVKFSRLIRTYLEHSQSNEVSLKEEIKALSLYLDLEKERFDDDFNFKITVDKSLNLETIFLPSLFIQPYVENALKHGLLHKKDNKRVQLNFIKDDVQNLLICEIIDNGIGREASENIKSQRSKLHKSFATSANQKRIDLLNRSQDKKVVLKVEDIVNEKGEVQGTKVIIKMTLTY
ncbi:sensor histidine kinase [Winogradskyella thalassocola]|uniref:Y_Y_Y domain-containing protein n=1 Tax=Winogradskyella thalassocola TaxID=262004 RepID=A0A1G7Z9Q8_9FLAO|nr:sensor histidine kinase [Winogradskyella thalassocola]SDH05438.1 Y_Y_Y domain-containing protein [Winogradskyella thalassocola]